MCGLVGIWRHDGDGRASQEAFGDGKVGLALMYPACLWSLCSGP